MLLSAQEFRVHAYQLLNTASRVAAEKQLQPPLCADGRKAALSRIFYSFIIDLQCLTSCSLILKMSQNLPVYVPPLHRQLPAV